MIVLPGKSILTISESYHKEKQIFYEEKVVY